MTPHYPIFIPTNKKNLIHVLESIFLSKKNINFLKEDLMTFLSLISKNNFLILFF